MSGQARSKCSMLRSTHTPSKSQNLRTRALEGVRMFSHRVFLLDLFASGLWAQTFRGSLTGTVADTSGGAIPICSVRLDNTATGFTRTVLTASAGEYNFPDLAPGL